jgi:hypothetical protein
MQAPPSQWVTEVSSQVEPTMTSGAPPVSQRDSRNRNTQHNKKSSYFRLIFMRESDIATKVVDNKDF